MTQKQFFLEYAKDINNIISITERYISENKCLVTDKEKLFKTLLKYIYLNSYQHY